MITRWHPLLLKSRRMAPWPLTADWSDPINEECWILAGGGATFMEFMLGDWRPPDSGDVLRR